METIGICSVEPAPKRVWKPYRNSYGLLLGFRFRSLGGSGLRLYRFRGIGFKLYRVHFGVCPSSQSLGSGPLETKP